MLTISSSISYTYWYVVDYYINIISEITLKKLDFIMFAKFSSQNIQIISPIVTTPLETKFKNKKNEQGSKIELFQWKLRKNLETLTFLAELESRYNMDKSLPQFNNECYILKTEIQQKTLELTKKIASCKTIKTT